MPEIETRSIEFPSHGSTTPGFMARPRAETSLPAIVVIQEYWGLVPHIEDVTKRFAETGFVALAPDLYHGRAAQEPDEAKKLAMTFDRERAIGEILSAASYLISLSYVAPKKIGVVGWCMGGGLALSTAAADHEGVIGAAVAFYGRPLSPEDVHHLRVPVLGHYGGADHGIPRSAVDDFEHELSRHGVLHDIQLYPDAPHAFFNDTRESYRPDAARAAWRRTVDWFRTYLR